MFDFGVLIQALSFTVPQPDIVLVRNMWVKSQWSVDMAYANRRGSSIGVGNLPPERRIALALSIWGFRSV